MKTVMSVIYCPDVKNLRFENPIQPGNELYYGYNPMYNLCGYHYDKEMFYLIDFWNIKDDMYYISSYGRVFSLHRGGREISSFFGNNYMRVTLRTNNNETKPFSVHRLVAMAFIPRGIEDYIHYRNTINHKNLIKTDNYYKNLEWTSISENTIHAFENNAHRLIKIIDKPKKESEWGKVRFGNDAGATRIPDEKIHIACQAHIQGLSNSECCIAAGLEDNQQNRNALIAVFSGRRRENIAKLYGITRETRRTTRFADRSEFESQVKDLIRKGISVRDIITLIPCLGEYKTARYYVYRLKKRMIKNGELT